MTNLAYKHLESKLKIGELTVVQWAGFFTGVMLAIAWAMYVSPFGAYITLITAIYLGGIPAAAAFLASVSDFDVWLHLRAMAAWRRATGRFQPGPGDSAHGYVLTTDERDSDDVAIADFIHLDLTTLWES